MPPARVSGGNAAGASRYPPLIDRICWRGHEPELSISQRGPLRTISTPPVVRQYAPRGDFIGAAPQDERRPRPPPGVRPYPADSRRDHLLQPGVGRAGLRHADPLARCARVEQRPARQRGRELEPAGLAERVAHPRLRPGGAGGRRLGELGPGGPRWRCHERHPHRYQPFGQDPVNLRPATEYRMRARANNQKRDAQGDLINTRRGLPHRPRRAHRPGLLPGDGGGQAALDRAFRRPQRGFPLHGGARRRRAVHQLPDGQHLRRRPRH